MWHTRTMGCYLALKKKEILTQATAWMNREDILPSEINQLQNHKSCMIPLTGGTYSSETPGDRKQDGGHQELWEGGKGALLFHMFNFTR